LRNEFIRLTGYHRKSVVRLLNARPVRQVLVYGKGQAVKIKPVKKRPANRAGKRAYTEEAVAALRPVRAFFRHKCAGNEVSERSPLFSKINLQVFCPKQTGRCIFL
jgi:hypothetical protein